MMIGERSGNLKKTVIFIVTLVICMFVCSCNRPYEPDQFYVDDIHEHFYEKYGIEMTDELITLDEAKNHYLIAYPRVLVDPKTDENTAKYMHYKHTLVSYANNIDCCIFDIEGYENLKFYSFIDKSVPELAFSTQTLFVDVSLKDREINCSVGDNISEVKSIFTDLQVVGSNEGTREYLKKYKTMEYIDKEFPYQEYYEIMDKNGIFFYEVDKDGKILSKIEIKITGYFD